MTDSEKMNLVLAKIDNLDEKMTTLDGKVDRLDSRVVNLESNMNIVKQDIIKLNTTIKVGLLAIRISRLESDVTKLKQKIS